MISKLSFTENHPRGIQGLHSARDCPQIEHNNRLRQGPSAGQGNDCRVRLAPATSRRQEVGFLQHGEGCWTCLMILESSDDSTSSYLTFDCLRECPQITLLK